jgi:uncharacterized repeat protein (TIGR01451 family)
MPRLSTLLLLLGALCFVAASVSVGLTLAVPAPVSAAGLRSIGTPTIPPLPTTEPTQIATAVPATATPTGVPTITTPPPTATTATPVASTPPATPLAPTRTPHPPRDPDPTATPLPTDSPSATPEPWTSEVTIVKQASASAVQPGETFVYTLVARNSGPHSAFDVVVRDDVPLQLAIIDLASTKGDIIVEGQRVTAYPGTLEPGETAQYRITVRVRANARPGALANTGRITTSTPGDTPENNISTVTVTIRVPHQVIQTTPPQLPRTADTAEPMLLALISPLAWAGMVGGLLVLLGGVLIWGLRGWTGRTRAGATVPASTQLAPANSRATPYQLPPAASAGPPRLGPALPAAQPAAPLPPLVPLDRDEALRDALCDDQGDER